MSCYLVHCPTAKGIEEKFDARVQIIDNFAAYNSDGFMSTLELLPMWQDVDPDVDLFGSGIVSELDEAASEWGTGHPLSLDGPSMCRQSCTCA